MSQKNGEIVHPSFGPGDWKAEQMVGAFDPVGEFINYLARLELTKKQGNKPTEVELKKLIDLYEKAKEHLNSQIRNLKRRGGKKDEIDTLILCCISFAIMMPSVMTYFFKPSLFEAIGLDPYFAIKLFLTAPNVPVALKILEQITRPNRRERLEKKLQSLQTKPSQRIKALKQQDQ